MKTNVQTTSLAAYRDLDHAGCERKVLAAMRPGQAYTDSELAKKLKRPPSWISARRNALIAAGLVEYVATVPCPITGRLVKAHRLAAAQLELLP